MTLPLGRHIIVLVFELLVIGWIIFTIFVGTRYFVRTWPRRNRRLYRAAQLLIQMVFGLDLIAIDYIDYVFINHRPSKPGDGFTFEYADHGTSTFITNGDHQLFILVWMVPFALLAISGLLYQLNRPDWQKVATQKIQL